MTMTPPLRFYSVSDVLGSASRHSRNCAVVLMEGESISILCRHETGDSNHVLDKDSPALRFGFFSKDASVAFHCWVLISRMNLDRVPLNLS